MFVLAYTYIYIYIHAYTFIYMHIHTYTFKYMHYQTLGCMYHSSFRLGEGDSVDSLAANPFLVANVDCREELDDPINVRHVFQPLQNRCKLV